MKSIVLFSAGLDSAVVLAQERARNVNTLALIIDYDQLNSAEISKAQIICDIWGIPWKRIHVPMEKTDPRAELPARNTVFLAKALEHALIVGADRVLYGAEPESAYVDGQEEYIDAMRKVFTLHGVELEAPLKSMKDRIEVMQAALDLGVPLDLLHSSRTDRVDGGCKTSWRFLRSLQSFIFGKNPVDVLFWLAQYHQHNANPYQIRTLAFKNLNWKNQQHGYLQALSRLPRPREGFLLAVDPEPKELYGAVKSLGYEVAENGIPLITVA